jgi:hypothetical protein
MTLRLLNFLAVAALCVACGPGSSSDDEGDTSGGSGSDGTGGDDGGPTSGPGTDTTDPDSTTTVDPTATDTGGDCGLPPVDDKVLGQLFIDAGLSSFVAAGTSEALRLSWIDAGFPTAVEACVEWSVEGDDVTIDAGGTVTVDAAAVAGSTFTVTADVEDGRRIITADFEVYVPLQADILGTYTEVQQLPCDGGAALTPDPIIGELVFKDTGEFSVTWTPFEVYYDYWGTFTYDDGAGALVLSVDGGNYVPKDIDGEGTATVVDGQLILEDMWLGVAQRPVTPVACGHVFE